MLWTGTSNKMAEEDGERKDNPFSFKNFMEKQVDVTQGSQNRNKRKQKTKKLKNPDIFEDEAPFPDVATVKQNSNRIRGSNKKGTQHAETDENGGENPFSYKNFMAKDVASRQKRVLKIIDDEVHEIKPVPSVFDVETDKVDGKPSYYVYLDDSGSHSSDADSDSFANDSEHGSASAQSGSYIVPPSDSSPSQVLLIEEVNRLRKENGDLKEKLLETIEEKNEENRRAAALEKKLVFIEKREKEETAALENMVHMVEKNLELTTQRALKAEAQVTRLKDEVKGHTKKTVPLASYQQLLTTHECTLTAIREKARMASEQMSAAARDAEQSIRQLYSGVDTLKFVTKQLDSIDRITDVKTTADDT